ncbi:glycosyltransferase family 1 protein [Oxalobacteraceae bacterium CAVE-383]|nr:glycosyltransferase family 1 protein [Oxalobacteraceae bacterium CAVE-383]
MVLKIALISDHASPLAAPGSIDCGGQNVYVAQLACQLAKLGYEVDVFTRRDCTSHKQVVHWQRNIRVINVPAGPANYVPKERILPYMNEFADFMTNFARRRKISYDVVHANFFMSGIVAEQFKRAMDVPYVITFHALGLVRRLSQGAADGFPEERSAIEQRLMRNADRIIAECPQDRLDMEQLYGADPARIDIVPCGFNPEELWPLRKQARRRLGLPANEFVVLQLGRMVPRKGVDNVIESMAVLRDRHGIDARLLVVGGEAPQGGLDSPELQRLMALSASLGLRHRTDFVGQKARGELRAYYSAADVFVTTPWYEPFGITPLEAMACATPVVGAAVGGIKTTVLEGVTGYLVPPKQPRALADRLALLHRNPAHARQLGEEGWRHAHRLYTWHSVAERIAAVYEKVVDDTRTEIALPYRLQANAQFSQLN